MEDSKERRGYKFLQQSYRESCWQEKHERGKLGLGTEEGLFPPGKSTSQREEQVSGGILKGLGGWGGALRDLRSTGIGQGREESQQKAKREDSSRSEG